MAGSSAGRRRLPDPVARLCILTPAPGYDEDWGAQAAHYTRLFGDDLEFRGWTQPGPLAGFDLVLPLLAWGYQRSAGQWRAQLDRWQEEGARFANPVEMLRWNTDKAYLSDLAARGVAVIPTDDAPALGPGDLAAARARWGCAALVVKPPVSGGADDTFLLGPEDAVPLVAAGRRMLVQPHLAAIADEGEYSLFHFSGCFSHAIVKRPARGDFRVQEQFGGREEQVDPPPGARELALSALAALPRVPLYARSDMVRGADGRLRLMELELIEPSLFLDHAPDGGQRLADAVEAWLSAS